LEYYGKLVNSWFFICLFINKNSILVFREEDSMSLN